MLGDGSTFINSIGGFSLPSSVAYRVASPEVHRKRRRELSLRLLADGPLKGHPKTMRPEHPPTSDSDSD